MTILLGLLFFLGLAALAVVHALFGDDDTSVRRCPDCGIVALYPRDGHYRCARCGARYRRGFDGRWVRE